MRTLLTTSGQTPAIQIKDITRCFDAAHEDGFWLDIEAPDEADYDLLEHTFKFHPLTIEDIRHQNQRPKVDEYTDYNFTVIFVAVWDNGDVALREQHLFVGEHYLITVHQEPSPQLKELQDRIRKSPELTRGKPAFLTYMAIDALVDASFPVLDKLDDEVDELEDAVEQWQPARIRDRVSRLRHDLLHVRRTLAPTRDAVAGRLQHRRDRLRVETAPGDLVAELARGIVGAQRAPVRPSLAHGLVRVRDTDDARRP